MYSGLCVLIVVLMVLPAVLVSCGGEEPPGQREDREKQEASRIASKWAKDEIDKFSLEIISAVIDVLADSINDETIKPHARKALATSAESLFADQLNKTISWEYAPPVKSAERRYDVTASARFEIKVLFPFVFNDRYSVRFRILLDIDTERAVVDGRQLDLSSIVVSKIPQE